MVIIAIFEVWRRFPVRGPRIIGLMVGLLIGGPLLAGCQDAPTSGAASEKSRASASSSSSDGDVAEQLCEAVDPRVVRSVVGKASKSGAAGKSSDDSWAWQCRWEGEYISVGPKGAVDQPFVEVKLYRQPLSITEGTAPPTAITVAGRSATMTRAGARLCEVVVPGDQRTLTVSMSTPVDRRDSCPRAKSVAQGLVRRFVQ
jgi:hypothetical protein